MIYRIKSAFHVLLHGHCIVCEDCSCDSISETFRRLFGIKRVATKFIKSTPEDLIDYISLIKLEDTPFFSRTNIGGMLHERPPKDNL